MSLNLGPCPSPTRSSSEASSELYDWAKNTDGTPHHHTAPGLRPATLNSAVEHTRDVVETLTDVDHSAREEEPISGPRSVPSATSTVFGTSQPSFANSTATSKETDHATAQPDSRTSAKDGSSASRHSAPTKIVLPVTIDAWESFSNFKVLVEMTHTGWNKQHFFVNAMRFGPKASDGNAEFKDMRAITTALREAYYVTIVKYIVEGHTEDTEDLKPVLPLGWFPGEKAEHPKVARKKSGVNTAKPLHEGVADPRVLPKIFDVLRARLERLEGEYSITFEKKDGEDLKASMAPSGQAD